MTAALTLALMATTGWVQQTDTVIPVDGATRLAVEAPGGSITVTAWDRPEIRIRASHSSRTFVDIDRRGSTIDVEAEARRGPATIIDYQIDAPASLDLELDGMYSDITVEGMDGEVEAEVLEGDIRIMGGSGVVKARSVTGEVVVEGTRGRVEVETVAEGVRITDVTGEVYAESVGGSLVLEDVRASVVEVGSVGGRIQFSGELQDGGRYFFGSHGGSVTLTLASDASATFHLATLHGGVTSDFPGAPESFERGERHAWTTGGGGALVEVETFGGRIAVNRR